jgi:hypothetical protein
MAGQRAFTSLGHWDIDWELGFCHSTFFLNLLEKIRIRIKIGIMNRRLIHRPRFDIVLGVTA